MVRILAFAFICVDIAATADAASLEGLRHVRSSSAAIRALVGRGYEQSAAFRSLVDAIEASATVVYIEPAVKLRAGREGALLHAVMGSPELPILRVLIKTNLGDANTIGVVAHELQHVVEAVTGDGLQNARAMTATFARLDRLHSVGGAAFETEAARKVQQRVVDELRANRKALKRGI
jgi:hypothetical protein